LERFQVIEQEQISYVVGGFRYGNKMRVLARSNDYLLVWIPGNTSCVYRTWSYQSAVLMVMRRDQHVSSGGVVICEKQSLNADMFAQYAVVINSIFGAGFNETLAVGKTIVVGDQPIAKANPKTPFGFARDEEIKKMRAQIVEELEIEVSYILAA
jgi:hypothetical protein